MNDLFGIDVSHHQKPAALPWETFRVDSQFCICRATYGTMRDREVAEHVRRARGVGLRVGLYHFFRPSQPAGDQFAAFLAAAQAAGYRPGDIVPALDVEADPIPKMQQVSPAWQEGVKRMLGELADAFEALPLVYITQREFGMLGRPEWLLDHPLWVAHYTAAKEPATPAGKPWTIWQHRVGPYFPAGPGGYDQARPELDQNRARGPLPTVQAVPWQLSATAVPSAHPERDDGMEALALARAGREAVDALGDDWRHELTGADTERPPPEGET